MYLKTRPAKIAWIVALNLFVGVFSYLFFRNIGDILEDSGWWIIVVMCIIITGIRIAVDLQPFIEWRDGYRKTDNK